MKRNYIKLLTLLLSIFLSCFALSACEEAHTHSYTDEIISPTCNQMGYTKHTCSCGHTYTDSFTNLGEHDLDENGKCKNCTYQSQPSVEHEHNFKQIITAPTCEENGYLISKCDCGEVESKTIFSNPLTHSFINYVYNNNATCEENGTETATCSRENCNKTNTRVKLNTKLDHNFVNYVYDNNATCQEDGTETATCSRNNCNITDTRVKSNSKTSHQNDSGKCKFCDYYFDATEFLEFEKCTIGNVEGYMVTQILDEGLDTDCIYRHFEVPTHYKGENDSTPLPVISIGYGAFSYGYINGKTYNQIKIKSIKLNEGLLEIRDWAFKNSEITELVIPNSVTNEFFKSVSGTYGTIYNVCGNKLDRFETGGIKVLGSYNFANGTKEVILGNGLKTIMPRAFYEIYSLEYLVIPASVNKIPEGTVSVSDNYPKMAIIKMLPDRSTTKIFMEITKAEHDALLVDQRKRDLQGNVLDPLPENSVGFVKGWSGNNQIYFKGEWHYDENGKPTPN